MYRPSSSKAVWFRPGTQREGHLAGAISASHKPAARPGRRAVAVDGAANRRPATPRRRRSTRAGAPTSGGSRADCLRVPRVVGRGRSSIGEDRQLGAGAPRSQFAAGNSVRPRMSGSTTYRFSTVNTIISEYVAEAVLRRGPEDRAPQQHLHRATHQTRASHRPAPRCRPPPGAGGDPGVGPAAQDVEQRERMAEGVGRLDARSPTSDSVPG